MCPFRLISDFATSALFLADDRGVSCEKAVADATTTDAGEDVDAILARGNLPRLSERSRTMRCEWFCVSGR